MAVLPKLAHCRGCVGWNWPCPTAGMGLVPADGPSYDTGWNGVLIVNEAAGADEVEAGRPLVGKAGQQFASMLQRAGLHRDNFRIANVLSCRPPGNELWDAPYQKAAIDHCAPLLDREIATSKPKVIFASGVIAFNRLLPDIAQIPNVGLLDAKSRKGARGYVFWSTKYNCWIVPSVHPSYIMRGQTHFESVYIHDIQKAVSVADGYSYDETNYTLDPPHYELDPWVMDALAYFDAHPEARLSVDIETPTKGDDEDDVDLDDPTYQILRVGFAYKPCHALSVPWDASTLPAIKALIEARVSKVWWNQGYDYPRLVANGMAIGGTQHDGMVAWHLLHSDVPKGLGFVATYCCPRQPMWKHESSRQPAYYNAVDSDVANRNMIATEAELKKAMLWPLYNHHILRLNPIRSEMSAAGMPIDAAVRLESAKQIDGQLQATLSAMQAAVPVDAKRKVPKAGFVRPPADTTGMTTIKVKVFVPTCSACGLDNPLAPHFKETKKVINPCSGAKKLLVEKEVERWARVETFVPSLQQITAYQKVKSHQPVTTGRGTDKRVTTDEKAINILIGRYKDDALYPLVLDYREYDKLGGNYIGRPEKLADGTWKVVGGMPVGRDGCVHTTFTDNPSTWRMSSVNPNLQNIPRGTDSKAQALVKGMFVAPQGHLIGSRDYSGIEARLVGWFAQDKDLYRLTALGVHDFYGLNLLYNDRKIAQADVPSLAWSDADLKAAFSQYKEWCGKGGRFAGHRDVSKRVIYLSLYKGTPMKMYQEYPKDFPSVAVARRLQKFLFDLFPSVPRWHETLCRQVTKDTFLRMPFGYIHRFYRAGAWEWTGKKWEWGFGDDAKRVIACGPQNTAAGILKEAAIRIGEGYPDVRSCFRLFIHDDITLLYPASESDRVRVVTKTEMEKPIECMRLDPSWNAGPFVTVMTEFKEGPTWATQKTVKE